MTYNLNIPIKSISHKSLWSDPYTRLCNRISIIIIRIIRSKTKFFTWFTIIKKIYIFKSKIIKPSFRYTSMRKNNVSFYIYSLSICKKSIFNKDHIFFYISKMSRTFSPIISKMLKIMIAS